MVFREAELLKSLKHKNIVKILNCYTLGNMQVVFIMEYLEGGELLEYVMERERLNEDEARIYFNQIVDAMGYCHKEKLIHRDLKLENLLLVKKGEMSVKV
jgi:serine/threonine protein kinase